MKFIVLLLALLFAMPASAAITSEWRTSASDTSEVVTYISSSTRSIAYLTIPPSGAGTSLPIKIKDGTATLCYQETTIGAISLGLSVVSVEILADDENAMVTGWIPGNITGPGNRLTGLPPYACMWSIPQGVYRLNVTTGSTSESRVRIEVSK